MALLELALDAVEVGGVEVVAGVRLLDDIVVDGALLEGAGALSLVVVLGHGGDWEGRGRRGGAHRERAGSSRAQVRGEERLGRRVRRKWGVYISAAARAGSRSGEEEPGVRPMGEETR